MRTKVLCCTQLLVTMLIILPLSDASASDDFTSSHRVRRSQLLMGTLVEVTAIASTEQSAGLAAAAALNEIRRLENIWSTWISTSELSRINAFAGVRGVRISPETLSLLKWSVRIGELTHGAFNIAMGPAIEAWNISATPRIPDDAELIRLKPLTDLSLLQINEESSTAFLAHRGMRIDVGGIAKGYAADYAVMAMRAAGASAGIVALSGDIKTFGEMPTGQAFVFGIRHPRQNDNLLGELELENEAISTAGDYERFFEVGGIRYHHILDPETLRPATGCQSVTIVASQGVIADGLDTGIFVLGPQKGLALVEELPGVEAVIVDDGGKVLISSGLKNRVRLHAYDMNDHMQRASLSQ
jgi:thiamine biosynthesis lipoprotein